MALVLATARDTAPMAMLPQSTGSAGSGGIMGFSVRASFVPGGKKKILIKDSFPGSLTGIKLYFSMLYSGI